MSAEHGVTSDLTSDSTLGQEFETLFLEHYPRLVKTLIRLVGNSGQAEELAADAFYRLHQHRSQNRSEENLAGWLYRTAVNLGLDALRANGRRGYRRATIEAARLRGRDVSRRSGELAVSRTRRRRCDPWIGLPMPATVRCHRSAQTLRTSGEARNTCHSSRRVIRLTRAARRYDACARHPIRIRP